MTPDTRIPLQQVGAEILFRSTLVAFSQAWWDIQAVGPLQLPPGPCFLYGNHSNNYDPFILTALSRLGQAPAGVMTMEYLERGPVAALFRAAGVEGTRKHMPEPHLIRRIHRLLEAGRRIIIFPEGGRRWDGRPAPWIESTAKLFQRMDVPVYPVRIHGSYVSWPRWARWPRPATVGVEVCPAVTLSRTMPLDDVLSALKAPISKDENDVDSAHRPPWAWRPADGLDRLIYRDPETGAFNGAHTRGGWHLESQGSGMQWAVQPDSFLTTRDGTEVSSATMYHRIRQLALQPNEDGMLISHPARIQVGLNSHALSPPRQATIRLCQTHVSLGEYTVPLEDIRFMGLERSDRLWLSCSGKHVYCLFPSGYSVLAWYDTLLRLAPHINS